MYVVEPVTSRNEIYLRKRKLIETKAVLKSGSDRVGCESIERVKRTIKSK